MTNEETKNIMDKYKLQNPVAIVDLAKELGLDVVETSEFKDSMAGSLSKEGDKFIIYINAFHPITRKRFTIAHEIAHYLKHQSLFINSTEHLDEIKQPVKELNRDSSAIMTEEQKNIEIEANEFAAELLMPKDLFVKVWENANSLTEVATQFKVSEAAAALRGKFLLGQTIV